LTHRAFCLNGNAEIQVIFNLRGRRGGSGADAKYAYGLTKRGMLRSADDGWIEFA
jgi:hypothetical protein